MPFLDPPTFLPFVTPCAHCCTYEHRRAEGNVSVAHHLCRNECDLHANMLSYARVHGFVACACACVREPAKTSITKGMHTTGAEIMAGGAPVRRAASDGSRKHVRVEGRGGLLACVKGFQC